MKLPQRQKILRQSRLYAILDSAYLPSDSAFIKKTAELLRAGVRLFQLRLKNESHNRVRSLVELVAPTIHAQRGLLILNDYAAWAAELPVDGVHVGQDDLSVSDVRMIIGSQRLVGLSTHSLDQVRAAKIVQPDYIGFGPLYSTQTKPNYPPIGLEKIREATHYIDPIPLFCIGGITLERLPSVIAAGAQRVVIVSALLNAENSEAYARQVIERLSSLSS
ncbi:MAG: thiamine phosphate synthase [Verrucomicrobiae bacterium]|nr:thiamine phosphate synthase [Verrucomicrobiae bacterium]